MSFNIMMVFGTRPEAIKMAPLARVLRQLSGGRLSFCATGQQDDEVHFERMSRIHSPYGDGHASERIGTRLFERLSVRSAAVKAR
ncbi:Glycosyl transferase [Pseudomonas sp. IT-P44]|jgi:UDP-N-acetylglucosamine 2-epimerase|nr:hypothetical protein [Pseudomonas sp. PDM02]MBD9615474.1 hypothetical protein [Pseudomonas sp. PDM02]